MINIRKIINESNNYRILAWSCSKKKGQNYNRQQTDYMWKVKSQTYNDNISSSLCLEGLMGEEDTLHFCFKLHHGHHYYILPCLSQEHLWKCTPPETFVLFLITSVAHLDCIRLWNHCMRLNVLSGTTVFSNLNVRFTKIYNF